MAAKHSTDAELRKLLQELEKLRVNLRPYAVDPAPRNDSGRKRTPKRARPKSPRSRVQALEQYILRRASARGQELLGPAQEGALAYQRGLQCYSMVMDLPPGCVEAFKLSRFTRLTHLQIGQVLNMDVSTVRSYLAYAAQVFRLVREFQDHEGVVRKGP